METIILENLKQKKTIANNQKGTVIELENGDVLKLFGEIYRDAEFLMKLIENKLNLLQSYSHIPEIVLPKAKVFSGKTGEFVGYTMDKTPGIAFPDLHENLPLSKLRKINYLTDLYLKIEEVIKKVNEKGIIIPDIGTMYNIMVDDKRNMNLID